MNRVERILTKILSEKYSRIPEFGVCFPASTGNGVYKTYALGFERTSDPSENNRYRRCLTRAVINTPASIVKKVPYSLRFKNLKYEKTERMESITIDFEINE